MLKLLVKKQLMEVFRSYFYDEKKNRMRPKWQVAAWFVFFILITVGLLGGMFTVISMTLCPGLTSVNMGWLYFLLVNGMAILLGAFGSVFNTYSGLYLSKDNELLLSLPIPIRTIMASRLINVYLMGTMYTATVIIPALIVYWVYTGFSSVKLICGILLFLILSFIVLLLSCLLGWVVAKISVKLKNKSYITVLVSLLFIAAYYFFYFKANDFITNILTHAETYGTNIKGAAYGLYLFGRIGEGDIAPALVFTAVTGLLFGLVMYMMSRSFLDVVTAGGSSERVKYKEKPIREKSVFSALLSKEFLRFTSSSNYMLNCGLGILMIPVAGIVLLLKGGMIVEAIDGLLSARADSTAVLLCSSLLMLSSMNDMAVPSVSLEGKSIWIPQTLPVETKQFLHAKVMVQIILTGIPILFASVCAAIILHTSMTVKVLLAVTAIAYTVFSSMAGMVLGIRMPLLNWTNELAPIKQSGAVLIILLGGWALSVVFAGLYIFAGYKLGAVVYLSICTAVFIAASLLMLRWLDTKGADIFAHL